MIDLAPQLSLAAARAMADAAAQKALTEGCAVVIVVVDAGGHLLLLERCPGAPLASIDVAQQKARCAALYGFATGAMAQAAKASPAMAALPHMMPFEGGEPIRFDGRIAGAVGVSGGSIAQDLACVAAAVAAFAPD